MLQIIASLCQFVRVHAPHELTRTERLVHDILILRLSYSADVSIQPGVKTVGIVGHVNRPIPAKILS